MIPLLVGVAELAYFVGRRPDTTNGQTAAYLPGIVLIMVGLVLAGPWLTMVARGCWRGGPAGPPRSSPGGGSPTTRRRLPRDQRARPRALRHHVGHRRDHHDRRRPR